MMLRVKNGRKRLSRKTTLGVVAVSLALLLGWVQGRESGVAHAEIANSQWQRLRESRIVQKLFRAQPKPQAVAAVTPKYLHPVIDLMSKRLPELSSKEHRELAELFLELCRKYAFSPALMLGLIHVESSFRPHVESYAGAVGLMQLLPSTAAPIAKELGLPWRGKDTLRDPKFNLRMGFHYLAYLRTMFAERKKYVTAYNWGPGRVGMMIERQQNLPLDYYRKIQKSQAQFAAMDRIVGL